MKKASTTVAPLESYLFELNKDTNYFVLQSEKECDDIPEEVTIHKRRSDTYKGQFADYLQSRQKNGIQLIKTGIRNVIPGFWYGDQFGVNEFGRYNHFLIIRLNAEKDKMRIYRFKNNYPGKKSAFVKKFVKHLRSGVGW